MNVAGPAALLVAKVHKPRERLAAPQRLIDKDARATGANTIADRLAVLDDAVGLEAAPGLANDGHRSAARLENRPDFPIVQARYRRRCFELTYSPRAHADQ